MKENISFLLFWVKKILLIFTFHTLFSLLNCRIPIIEYTTPSYPITKRWDITTIDADIGLYSSIAIDSTNNVHISYYDYSKGQLKYVTNRTSKWVSDIVASYYNLGWRMYCVGLYTSIAIDTNDKVHITYCDYFKWDLKHAVSK